jgi:hypothetical protein
VFYPVVSYKKRPQAFCASGLDFLFHEFVVGFLESRQSKVEIFSGVRRTDLCTDTGFSFGYNREEETDDINTFC